MLSDIEFLQMQISATRTGGRVVRYHTYPSHGAPQNVAQHSFGVAILIDILWPEASKAVLQAALKHDLAEQAFGDIPSHTKWADPELAKRFDDLEERWLRDKGLWNELNESEQRMLRLADLLELILWASEQLYRGDTFYQLVHQRGMTKLQEYISWPETKRVLQVLNLEVAKAASKTDIN